MCREGGFWLSCLYFFLHPLHIMDCVASEQHCCGALLGWGRLAILIMATSVPRWKWQAEEAGNFSSVFDPVFSLPPQIFNHQTFF